MSNVPSSTPDGLAPEQAVPNPSPGEPAPMMMPNLLSPSRTVSLLSEVRSTQPVVALAAANQYQAELTPVFLEAVERALNDPANDFAQHGMIFNYAVYFLAQWRERRALPLFVRWFSLPGEDALELGGDTVTLHGARLLACVSDGEVGPIQQLVTNREANGVCRAVALASLGVSLAWQRWARPEAEAYLTWLAREGLERTAGPVWAALTGICVHLEVLPAFPELLRARDEKLIPDDMLDPADLDKVTQAPRGELSAFFAEKHPPITDVIHETRWWAGFQQPRVASPPQPQRILKLPEKERVGRNDPCPCGSGKKFKKCCGA